MSLAARFAGSLAALKPGSKAALVAVSGGRDSVVLLDLLVRTQSRHGLDLIVAHADHGIHPESALVAGDVMALAAGYGLPCVTAQLALGPDATETEARAARYRWLRRARRELDARWIVTAHQADDQTETILMRMLRGSGPHGLAGMRGRERDVLRPLLFYSTAALDRYARRHQLRWWEDPANQDPVHLRSWIRRSLLPELAVRLPDIRKKLAETRRHARRGRAAWSAALRSWPELDARLRRGDVSLRWEVLRALPASLATTLAESLIRSAGGPVGPRRIERALATLRGAQSGARADLGQGWRFEIAFERLRVLPPVRESVADQPAVPIHLPAGATRWKGWLVRWRSEPAPAPAEQPRAGRTAWFVPGALSLRAWRPGDRLSPLRGRGQRLAVRCFHEARVPRSERLAWPMIEDRGGLTWIPGVCRSTRLVPAAGAPSVRIDVEPWR
ncbi:MAG TPA: tRNA lysidine(34) synthetase TilS [Gemmatimonadales bacterium]|nr:tRNA lysidine(34) synthetase TilS [Gemmatimonadales bacterium]